MVVRALSATIAIVPLLWGIHTSGEGKTLSRVHFCDCWRGINYVNGKQGQLNEEEKQKTLVYFGLVASNITR